MEEDLRSLRSEYDYGSKKKFVDVLGNVSAQTKLNRMRAQHEMEKAGGPKSSGGLTSYKSHATKQSARSRFTDISKVGGRVIAAQGAAIPEEVSEDFDGADLEAKPEDFVSCNNCLSALNDDEKIINARFVNEAMAAHRDITVFPICIGCNFDNLAVN